MIDVTSVEINPIPPKITFLQEENYRIKQTNWGLKLLTGFLICTFIIAVFYTSQSEHNLKSNDEE